ncbi:hypothetical protein L0Y49_04610, partial [bacterium]|nr:hypothetical protein [bacterium]
MKTVYILMGPKGSGKTYVGTILQQYFGVRFLSVEKIFMQISHGRDISNKHFLKEGYDAVLSAIGEVLATLDGVCIESTGAFYYFPQFLKKLRTRYAVKLIRVLAPLPLCLERIQERDEKKHIPMSRTTIEEVYHKSMSLRYRYLLTINNTDLTEREIL